MTKAEFNDLFNFLDDPTQHPDNVITADLRIIQELKKRGWVQNKEIKTMFFSPAFAKNKE